MNIFLYVLWKLHSPISFKIKHYLMFKAISHNSGLLSQILTAYVHLFVLDGAEHESRIEKNAL